MGSWQCSVGLGLGLRLGLGSRGSLRCYSGEAGGANWIGIMSIIDLAGLRLDLLGFTGILGLRLGLAGLGFGLLGLGLGRLAGFRLGRLRLRSGLLGLGLGLGLGLICGLTYNAATHGPCTARLG